MRRPVPNHRQPSVSVIVPVRNEVRSIGPLLESLAAQTRVPDEVVVCDGGSTDGTLDIVARYAGEGMRITVLREKPAYPGRGRNLAIQAAQGEIIALTDAGIRLDAHWLECLLAPFENSCPPDVVFGRFEPVTESFLQRCIALAFVPPSDPRTGLRTPSVASMAMRRGVWTRVGGFREDLRSAEDLLFIRGISKARFSVGYAPDAIVFWSPPEDFVGVFRRFAAYSGSNIRAGLIHEWQFPLLRIYLLMALLSATLVWSPLGGLAPVTVIGARAAKRVAREMGVRALFNVPVIAGVMATLAVIDMATLYGCWHWLATSGVSRTEQGIWPWTLRRSREG